MSLHRILCGYSKRMPDGSIVRYRAGSTVDLTPEDLARLHPSYVIEVPSMAVTEGKFVSGYTDTPVDKVVSLPVAGAAASSGPPDLPLTDPSVWVSRNLDDKLTDGE